MNGTDLTVGKVSFREVAGWPAFPAPAGQVNQGMSQRAYIATHCLQAMLTNGFQPDCVRENHANKADFSYTRAAIALADALIAQLNTQ